MKKIHLLLINYLIILIPLGLVSQTHWNNFGDLNIARQYFGAVAINDKEILVVGGYNDSRGVLSSCEVIDIKSKTITFGPSMNSPRAYFPTLITKDSNIIVISGVLVGFSRLTNSVELFDKKTRTWKHLGNLIIPRWQHSAEFLNEYEILVVGGRHANNEVMDDVEIFNINTGQSRLMNPYPFPSSDGVCGTTSNNRIVFYSGRSGGQGSFRSEKIFYYDYPNDNWVICGSLNRAVNCPTVVKLINGKLVTIGGSYDEIPDVFSKEVYIENNGIFSYCGNVLLERIRFTISQFYRDSLLIIGGYTGNGYYTNKCDWYNIRTNQAFEGPSLNYARYNHCSVTMKDYRDTNFSIVLAIGGNDNYNNSLSSIEILENYIVYPDPIITSSSTDCDTYYITAYDSLMIDEVVLQNSDGNINLKILEKLPTDKVSAILTLKDKNKTSFFTITFTNLKTKKSVSFSDSIRANPKTIHILSNIENGTIQLGLTKSGNLKCTKLLIKNSGNSQYTITDAILKRNVEFSIPQSQFPIILESGESKEFEICYLPSLLRKQWDTLCIKDICDFTCFPVAATGDTVYYNGGSRCEVPIILKTILPAQFLVVKAPYPNPTNSYFRLITIENAEYPTNCTLFDYMGNKTQEIKANLITDYSFEGNDFNEKLYEANLSAYPIGLYFLVIQNKASQTIYPIILR